MSADEDRTVAFETWKAVMSLVGDYQKLRARELSVELQDLDERGKLEVFSDALETAGDDEDENRRIFELFLAAAGSDTNMRRRFTGRYHSTRLKKLKVGERRSLLARFSPEDFTEEQQAEYIKFARADEFYSGDFYVPKIGHLEGYRGDFDDGSATLNEKGWYHFGRLLKVNYYRRELTLTNELGQQVVLHYDPKNSAYDVDQLVAEAVKYKGQSILVLMKTGAVDPHFDSDEFFAWSNDPKNVVGSVEERTKLRAGRRTVARINNKSLAGRVAKKRRDHANHATSPNYKWVKIGKLAKVTESKNAVTLQGTEGPRRHFIRKHEGWSWEEVRTRADKLEGQEVMLCLADRGTDRTPNVIDVVPAADPIRFIEERYEFSAEEAKRRRAAMAAAEEEYTQQRRIWDQQRQEAEQEHEERVAHAMYEARQRLDARLMDVKAEEDKHEEEFNSNMENAKLQFTAAINEQRTIIENLVILQDTLRKEAEALQAQQFLEEAEKAEKEPPRSKARQLADSINQAPPGRAPREATQHLLNAASQQFAEGLRKGSIPIFNSGDPADNAQQPAAAAEDPRDLEIRLLQAELRAEKAEKNQAISDAKASQLKVDITNYRMQSETYRNMSESDRQDLLAQLADYHQEQWTDEERKLHKEAAAELAEKLRPRLKSSFPVNIPGRYARTSFAMRSGKVLSDDKQLTIELREHLWGNDYRVFIEEHMVEIVACLQKDKRNPNQIAAVTFKSLRKGWQKAENEVNGGLTIKKGMSLEEAVKIFEDTQAKLDFTDL